MANNNRPSSASLPKTILESFTRAFHVFTNIGALSGVILILSAVIALVWVNFISADSYHAFWDTHFTISFGDFRIDRSLHVWINDGLMALFFFYIGLEIKREIMVGELSDAGKVVLPISAALGGMLLPAFIYITLLWNEAALHGWGIPMATDIAFSLGILMLLGDRVPNSLKIFLTAFAIVDDLGAVLIIAIFYSQDIQVSMLMLAGAAYIVMWIFNFLNFRKPISFILPALVMWYFVLMSGVHPTVAGILAALAIPASNKLRVNKFVDQSKQALNNFLDANIISLRDFLTPSQLESIDELQTNVKMVAPPLQRMEYALDDYVAFLIMPLFALSNAGVMIQGGDSGGIFSGLTIAILLSMIAGKVIGISLFSWLAVKARLAVLPNGMNFLSLIGIAFLGGVGFTMSLFIANLAFQDEELLSQAKIGILAASFLAGLIGFLVLKLSLKKSEEQDAEVLALTDH
jgi:NhaA family Na+:H+ antiporter